MFELPRTPRLADLRGFWLSCSLLIGLLTASAALVAQVPLWAGIGLAAAVIFVTIGWRSPAHMGRAYRAWNRLARRVGRLLRSWLTITVYGILAVAGWFGARLPISAPADAETGWLEKNTLPAEAFRGQSSLVAPAGDRTWLADLATWGNASGNRWTLALIPFLAVLSTVEAASGRPVTGKNYTLY